MGPTGFLGMIFITLKLMGYIHWSWWWVTSPFWIGIIIYAGVYTFAVYNPQYFIKRK